MVDFKDREAAFCTLTSWTGGTADCRWCDQPLPKRRRRWCSDECAAEWVENHWWAAVCRVVPRERDGVCEECGISYENARLAQGITLDGRNNQFHGRAGVALDRRGRPLRFEVHHVVPLNGVRPSWGCVHHKDGLRLLCLACHNDAHAATPRAPAVVRPPQMALELEDL